LTPYPITTTYCAVRPAELFCDSVLPGRCIAQLPDGRPLYFDDDHPNEIGARMIAEEVIQAMQSKGWLDSLQGGNAL